MRINLPSGIKGYAIIPTNFNENIDTFAIYTPVKAKTEQEVLLEALTYVEELDNNRFYHVVELEG